MIRSRIRARGGVINSSGSTPADPTPAELAAIYGAGWWLDASDTSTISLSGSEATAITDKFTGTSQATATSGSRPDSGTRTQNSLNVLDFDGLVDIMTMPSAFLDISSGSNTLFVVFVSDNTGDATQQLICGKNGSGGVRYSASFTATNLQVQNRTTSSSYTSQSLTRSTTVRIVGFRRSGTAIEPFIDGVEGTAGTNAENFTSTSIVIGGQTSGIDRFNGMLCETVAYRGYLSDAHMDVEGNRLATKWGASWTNINFP